MGAYMHSTSNLFSSSRYIQTEDFTQAAPNSRSVVPPLSHGYCIAEHLYCSVYLLTSPGRLRATNVIVSEPQSATVPGIST